MLLLISVGVGSRPSAAIGFWLSAVRQHHTLKRGGLAGWSSTVSTLPSVFYVQVYHCQ